MSKPDLDDEGQDGPECDHCGNWEPGMEVFCKENDDNYRLDFACYDCALALGFFDQVDED